MRNRILSYLYTGFCKVKSHTTGIQYNMADAAPKADALNKVPLNTSAADRVRDTTMVPKACTAHIQLH